MEIRIHFFRLYLIIMMIIIYFMFSSTLLLTFQKAFEALGLSTHLYDRRLVLEWAKEDETVEELRKRTAEHFLGGGWY